MWAVIALLALGMAGIMRQVNTLVAARGFRVQTVGPRLGSLAPEIDGLKEFSAQNSLLVFAAAECEACNEAIEKLSASLERQELSEIIVALYAGSADGYENDRISILENQEAAFAAFEVPVTPFAVRISDGIIRQAGPIGGTRLLDRAWAA